MVNEPINEKELQTAAEQGDTVSMLQWGNFLMTQNKPEEAVNWWEKAAEGGRAGGAYNLARHYSGIDNGIGNAAKMAEWLNRLAYAHNDGWGMLQLGVIMCGGTHPLWKKNIILEDFAIQRNIEEGLRLIISGVKRAESTTKDLTLYDYDAAAEVVRAYSGPLGIEVLKLALAYKTKARGLIPPGYKAMSEAAGNVISQLQSEIEHQPQTTLPARIDVTPRTSSGEPPRAPTRVVAAPMRSRPIQRHVPPPNDIKRRDPRAGFGLALQAAIAGVFMVVTAILLAAGIFNFDRETFASEIQLRGILYGILALVALIIGAVSVEYRWGALESGRGLLVLVVLGGLYGGAINVIHEQANQILTRAPWEVLFSALGVTLLTTVSVSLLMWIFVKIFDNTRITRVGKACLYVLIAGVLGGGMFYLLWRVIPDNVLIEVLASPFRSVPFVWIAILPGALLLRWAEDI
ncbi:MAG: hypothetical protein FWC16_13650 [Defluviitaleaceae bacterium]|nr:hypothetical protein [Defluviitaleaceae bacterium]MCL2275963.1 hypothetical protein [Defluviitaleaceae bacterium]